MHSLSIVEVGFSVAQTGWNIVKSFIEKRAHQVKLGVQIQLDPMSTIVRVAILAYCEINTKLSIEKNKVIVQTIWWGQGMMRTWRNDSRADLGELLMPVCTALADYPPNTANRQAIYRVCRAGFLKLMDTYTKDIPEIKKITDLTFITLNYCIGFLDQELARYQMKKTEETMNELKRPQKQEIGDQVQLNQQKGFPLDQYLYPEQMRTAIKEAKLWTENSENVVALLLLELERMYGKSNVQENFEDQLLDENDYTDEINGCLQSLLTLTNSKDSRFEKAMQKSF